MNNSNNKTKLRYHSPSVTSLQYKQYQIESESEEYFQEWEDDIAELQLQHKKACNIYDSILNDISQIDQKIDLLQNFKEQNEIELRQSVDGLKYELRAVREELKTLEKEKYTIAGKVKTIEEKYKEAKESFKNVEEVLTYTNRMIIHNDSQLSSQGSRLQTHSNPRFEFENSVISNNAENGKPKIDFLPKWSSSHSFKEDDADMVSSEIINRYYVLSKSL